MKRWRPGQLIYDPETRQYVVVRNGMAVEVPQIDVFIAEIKEVCRKHGMSIGHEDSHGAFTVERFVEDDRRLDNAHDEWSEEKS